MTTAAKPKTPAELLREPFPPSAVGKLPRMICKACSEAQGKVCGEHKKQKCGECGNYMSTAHIHLDYVGHAAVTDRLLQADPAWTYRLLAANEDGSPVAFTSGLSDPLAKMGIWIVLVLAGIETPGFGEGKNFKEAIGDAIRNAAMRRGVALDLWSKEDLGHDEAAPPAAAKAGEPVGGAGPSPDVLELRAKLEAVADQLGALEATKESIAKNWALGSPEGHVVWLERQITTSETNLARKNSPFLQPEAAKA